MIPTLRKALLKAAKAEGNSAASRAFTSGFPGRPSKRRRKSACSQIIGGHAVGMSTAPETILARRFGLKVAALSVITNLGAGIKGASPSHEETKREGAKAAERMKTLLTRFFKDLK